MQKKLSIEEKRLQEPSTGIVPTWEKWGPYVCERSWGTVREDYSEDGDPWSYFPFDLAQSKVYRWGEDAIAGWCDRYQVLVFAPAFWNGKDPFIKERLFGLSSPEGNHGEDVKDYYYHLDAIPSYSYLKFAYKYPQNTFPYQELRERNSQRNSIESEFELIDTHIFSENHYFDISIEYAKVNAEDIFIKIEAVNRSDRAAPLYIIPQLLFRNQWGWGGVRLPEPKITRGDTTEKYLCLIADDTDQASPPTLDFNYHLGKRYFYAPIHGAMMFTNNDDPNTPQNSTENAFYKDAFNKFIVNGKAEAINPAHYGTKAGIQYIFDHIEPQQSVVLYFRLSDRPQLKPFKDVESIIKQRQLEADEFYNNVHPQNASKEERKIQRQALAGILWNKQIYLFDVNLWLKGDNVEAKPSVQRFSIRNGHWRHLNSMRLLTMPDKWEFPYFCAWDQAFHCLSLGLLDLRRAKNELLLLLFDQFQHANGQIPACEWEFSDLNPPLQSWATLQLFNMEYQRFNNKDYDFLKKCFHKLIINFTWWVNKVDNDGHNVFEGGFLGLDNITVVDRSQKIGDGATLKQCDGTAWMAMFCLNLMRMALELAKIDRTYELMATKFFEHFVYIAHAMKRMGHRHYELWSEEDGFFYDVLTYPDGHFSQFKVRSLVGLIPLFAVDILEEDFESFPDFFRDVNWFLNNRPDLVENCIIPVTKNDKKSFLLALLNPEQLGRVLKYVWDPKEFRSEFGIRSLSKYHETNPYVFQDRILSYESAESREKIKGGNSNWRGPVWMPTNYLLIQSLLAFHHALPDFKLETSDASLNLQQMAAAIADQLLRLFSKNSKGDIPCLGEKLNAAHFNEYLLFNEYFNPETGQGLGASHQTGWTALIANLIDEFRK